MISLETAHPDPEEFYGRRARLYHVAIVVLSGYSRGLRAFFARSNYLQPGYRILDAGCGTGVLTRNLSILATKRGLKGITFHAFDLTQGMLDVFHSWVAKEDRNGIEMRKANVLCPEELPNDWKGYDLVVTASMLEHLPRDQMVHALRTLASHLKEDGKMLVFITRRNILMKYLIQKWWRSNLYTPEEMERSLEAAGFRRVERKRFPFPHQLLGLWGLIYEVSGMESPGGDWRGRQGRKMR